MKNKTTRPKKPSVKKPTKPRKPTAPSEYLTYHTVPAWNYRNKLPPVSETNVLTNDTFKVRINKTRISIMGKDPNYDTKRKVYKEKMIIYKEQLKAIAPEMEVYEKIMKKYELDLARYLADEAEKNLLKAKEDYYK